MNNASKGRMFRFITYCLSASYKVGIFCCCICCCSALPLSLNNESSCTCKRLWEKALSASIAVSRSVSLKQNYLRLKSLLFRV
jgi:hypothetical protein